MNSVKARMIMMFLFLYFWEACRHAGMQACRADRERECVKSMLFDVWGVGAPRPFQVEAITFLAFGKEKVLVCQQTGAGKTLVLFGAWTLLGGVTIFVTPLISLGNGIAARAMGGGRSVIHLDAVFGCNRSAVKSKLGARRRGEGPVLVVTSPQALLKGSFWRAVVHKLFQNNAVSLVCIDEAHCVPMHGTATFRPEFAKLKENLLLLARSQHHRTPEVYLSASLSRRRKDALLRMIGLDKFERVVWGWPGRREIKLEVKFTPQSTTPELKKFVKRRLRAGQDDKVVVYTESRTRAAGPLAASLRAAMQKENISSQLLVLHGETPPALRYWVVANFCDRLQDVDCRLLLSTSAGNYGISPPRCTAVGFDGIPSSMEDLVQRAGRAGRQHGRQRDLVALVAVSLGSVTLLMKRIAAVPCLADRSSQTSDFMEVLKFVVLASGCKHAQMERMFTGPTASAASFGGDCGGACSFCLGQHGAPRVNVGGVVNALSVDAFLGRRCPAREAVNVVHSRSGEVWPGGEATKGCAVLLILQLLAAEIVGWAVAPTGIGGGRSVELFWKLVGGSRSRSNRMKTFAHREEQRWEGIPHHAAQNHFHK